MQRKVPVGDLDPKTSFSVTQREKGRLGLGGVVLGPGGRPVAASERV